MYSTDSFQFPLGQFQHREATIAKGPTLTSKNNYRAVINLEGPTRSLYSVKAHLGKRKNMELSEHISCWHVSNNGLGLIDGAPEQYVVPKLYHRGSQILGFYSTLRIPDKSPGYKVT